MSPLANQIVYIVDDDDAVRDSTTVLLESAGLEIRAFASGQAFLESFDPAAAGCIILDLHMPGISGFEMLDILRARGNRVPVILFSGRTDPATDAFAKNSGAVAILAKPVVDDELVCLIQHLIPKAVAA